MFTSVSFRGLLLVAGGLVAGCGGLYTYQPDSGVDAGTGGGSGGGVGGGGAIGGGAGGGLGGGGGGGTDSGGGGNGSDAGIPDAGTPDAGTPDAGTPDAGSADAGPDAGPAAPVTPVTYDWQLRGDPSVFEASIAAVATPTHILWVRYASALGGRISVIDRTTHALVDTQVTDLDAYNVATVDDRVAIIGRGVLSVSDWRVHWLNAAGVPVVRSDTMNVVVAGGGVIAGAMYRQGDAGYAVHVLAPRDSSGTQVSALTKEDGGVDRLETPCGNTQWWDAATDGANRRFFIGLVAASCNLGNGSFVSPAGGQVQWVLVRHTGVTVPGVPIVRELAAASKSILGPAALGANADSVWIAYYAPTGHLRMERFSSDAVASLGEFQATGQAYVTSQAVKGLSVNDIVPHPNPLIDRVYLLATVRDSKSTWRNEVFPALNQSTLAIFTFTKLGVLLGVQWVPSSNAPKTGSTMAFIDGHLIVSGQCESTPSGGTTDSLCNPLASNLWSSFVFSVPAQ